MNRAQAAFRGARVVAVRLREWQAAIDANLTALKELAERSGVRR